MCSVSCVLSCIAKTVVGGNASFLFSNIQILDSVVKIAMKNTFDTLTTNNFIKKKEST